MIVEELTERVSQAGGRLSLAEAGLDAATVAAIPQFWPLELVVLSRLCVLPTEVLEKAPAEEKVGPVIKKARKTKEDDAITDIPPWFAPGLLVRYKAESAEEASSQRILSVDGAKCELDPGGSATLAELVPVVPSKGMRVRIITGAQAGMEGTLNGMAGSRDAVVQIGPFDFKTLPLRTLAAT